MVNNRNETFAHSASKAIRTFSEAWANVLERTGVSAGDSYGTFRRALLRVRPQFGRLRRWHRETNALLVAQGGGDGRDFREWACPAAAIDAALGADGEGVPPDAVLRAGAAAVDAWVLGVHRMMDVCALHGVVVQWPDGILLYKEDSV